MATRVEAWLAAACEDADRRGMPDLKPLLESLARSMAGLREAEASLLRAQGSGLKAQGSGLDDRTAP